MDNNSLIISIINLKYSITTNYARLQHTKSSPIKNSHVSSSSFLSVCLTTKTNFFFYCKDRKFYSTERITLHTNMSICCLVSQCKKFNPFEFMRSSKSSSYFFVLTQKQDIFSLTFIHYTSLTSKTKASSL